MGFEEEQREWHKLNNPGFIKRHPVVALLLLWLAGVVFWNLENWYGR